MRISARAGIQRNLVVGTTTISVTATEKNPPSGERARVETYRITVTRADEIGSALSGLDLFEGSTDAGTSILLDPPGFDSDIGNRTTFTAEVALSVATLTVRAVAKPGWTVEYLGEADADADTATHYQRRLVPLPNTNTIRVRATPNARSGDAQLHHHRDADDHARSAWPPGSRALRRASEAVMDRAVFQRRQRHHGIRLPGEDGGRRQWAVDGRGRMGRDLPIERLNHVV